MRLALHGQRHALTAYAASILFGAGWGLSWLSAHVLLLRYFGAAIVGDMTAMATTVTTLAVLGPIVAGRVADVTGSFSPILLGLAALLGLVTLSTAFLLPCARAARGTRARALPRHPPPSST